MDWELVYHELSISLTSSLKFGSVGRTIFLTAEAITTNENFKSPVPVDKLDLFLKVELGFAEYFNIQKSLDSNIQYEIPCGNQSLPTLYIDSWALISYQAFMIKQRSQIWARKKNLRQGKIIYDKIRTQEKKVIFGLAILIEWCWQ